MKWHVLIMRCPGCNGRVVPVDEVAFRADQMVRIEGNCTGCNRRLFIEETWQEAIPADELPQLEFDLTHWQPHGKPN